MKKILSILILLGIGLYLRAQEYSNPPGTDKFAGIWVYINGIDTIKLKAVARYVEYPDVQARVLDFYYTYKQGNSILWDNIINSSDTKKRDLGGSRPYGGSNYDTLEVAGRDKLKRKKEEGYIIINSAGDQLTFKRDIGMRGGGVRFHTIGQEPLPGYTLPATFTLTKETYTSARH